MSSALESRQFSRCQCVRPPFRWRSVFNTELFTLKCFWCYSCSFLCLQCSFALLWCTSHSLSTPLTCAYTHTASQTSAEFLCASLLFFNKYAKICYFNVFIRSLFGSVTPSRVSYSFIRIVRCISFYFSLVWHLRMFAVTTFFAFLSFIRYSFFSFILSFFFFPLNGSLILLEFQFSRLCELILFSCSKLVRSFVHSSSFKIATCTSKGYSQVAKECEQVISRFCVFSF